MAPRISHHHYILAAVLGLILLIVWSTADAFFFCFSVGSRSHMSAPPPYPPPAYALRQPLWGPPGAGYRGAPYPPVGYRSGGNCALEQINPSARGQSAFCPRP